MGGADPEKETFNRKTEVTVTFDLGLFSPSMFCIKWLKDNANIFNIFQPDKLFLRISVILFMHPFSGVNSICISSSYTIIGFRKKQPEVQTQDS